jgi:hypothetical protein
MKQSTCKTCEALALAVMTDQVSYDTAMRIKELSDSDIDEVYKSIKGNFWESAYRDFARAILKKASTK